MKSRSRKTGFTLVELLVVISIIALLLAIIIPSMNKARDTAKRVVCSNQLKEIARAISMYADSYNGWMPFYGGQDPTFDDKFDSKYNRSPAKDEAHPYAAFRANDQWMIDVITEKGKEKQPVPMKLGCVYRANIIKDPRIFYCPANTTRIPDTEQYQYESYIHPMQPNPSYEWGTLPQQFNADNAMNQWVRVGYTYYPVDLTAPRDYNGEIEGPQYTARKFAKLDSHIPFLADVLWYRRTMSHRTKDSYATNAAFKDTHVVYCNDWRFFSDNIDADPQRLWPQWEPRTITFNYFYYNFLMKIQP